MTYRELTKYLGRLTADQLDSEIVVELGDLFYRVEDGLNIASGEGDYLYKDEVYLSCDTNELCTKEFDEDGFALNEEVERLNNCDLIKE